MANQILGSDKIVRLNDYSLVGLAQSVDWSPNFNAQDVFELGRDTKVATSLELETSGSLELLSIGGTAGLLARAMITRTAGVFTGYQYDSAGAPGKNGYTFTHTDFKDVQFDLIIHEKPDQVSYTRAVVLPRCFMTSLSGRADANGMASETLNFAGEFVYGAVSPYHDVRAIPATVDTVNNRLVLADNTVVAANYTVMYAYVDDIRLRTTNTDAKYCAFDGANARLNITGMQMSDHPLAVCSVIVFKTTPSTTFPVIASNARSTTAFFVRGWQVNIFIAPANATSPADGEKWLKVQSADWNIDMRTEALRQLSFQDSGSAVYCRVPTYPLNITANVSIYEGAWEDWKAILSKSFPGNDKYADSYDFSPNSLKDSFAVVIEYRTKAGVLLQRWVFQDMRVDGHGQRTAIGGRAELSWSLSGTQCTLYGFNA